jgi:hypothetical protein
VSVTSQASPAPIPVKETKQTRRRAEERWEVFAGAARSADAPVAALSEEELVELSKAFREDG